MVLIPAYQQHTLPPVRCALSAPSSASHVPQDTVPWISPLWAFVAGYCVYAYCTVQIAPTGTTPPSPSPASFTQTDLGLPFYAVPYARHSSSYNASSAPEPHARPEGHDLTKRRRSPAYTAAGTSHLFVTAHQPERACTFRAVLPSHARPFPHFKSVFFLRCRNSVPDSKRGLPVERIVLCGSGSLVDTADLG